MTRVVLRTTKPADIWPQVLLDAVAKRGSGHTPDKEIAAYWGGNIPWVSLADSERLDKVYISETTARTTPAGIANSSAVVHPPGTVILSRDAGIGKSAITTSSMAVSQHFMCWTCGPQLNNLFLYYWLQSQKPEFERISNGSTIKTIGLPYFRDLRVPLPPLPEQRAIAAALSDADALVAALDALIAKKRAMKQGAMQQLLTGKTRLPGFEGEWQTQEISAVGSCIRGVSYGPSDVKPGGSQGAVPLLRATNIQRDAIVLDDVTYVARERVKPEQFLRALDVLVCMSNGSKALVGKSAPYPAGRPETTFGAFMSCVRFDERLAHPGFFSHLLRGRGFRDAIDLALAGSTINNLTPGFVEGFAYSAPAIDEQAAIAEVLDEMDGEITVLEARREKAKMVKQGMMQALLTGRVRLPVQEEASA